MACARCHGASILRHARLSSGELLVKGETVTGFANVEEDFADDVVWSAGLLPRGRHIQPSRIEGELKKLGANYVHSGPWRGFAIRDGNLVTGQQNFSVASVREAVAGAEAFFVATSTAAAVGIVREAGGLAAVPRMGR